MTDFVRNAVAVLFAVGGLLALISLVARTEPVLLSVGLLIASIAGVVLSLQVGS